MGHEEYDLVEAFQRIEDELIASMIRNLRRHRAEEDKEGILWSQWQTVQLKALEDYKARNQKKYQKKFRDLNKRIDSLIREAKAEGNMEQEIEILEAIKNGFHGGGKMSSAIEAEFFRVNQRKLDALVSATVQDMKKAETAVLRMANDQYRKIIYNAQVYANTGAGTYERAVDMATKDFLAVGINCIQYANGSRHRISDYADMAIKTAAKRAYLQGEGEMRQSWGIATVIVNKRQNPCPKCLPFCGKVLMDDVWSGGPSDGVSPLTGLKYPLMSTAVEAGFYHPRCKDIHTTYFEGISTPPDDKHTKEEINAMVWKNKQEAREQYSQRQAEKYDRLAKYSLDEENQKKYAARREEWRHVRLRTGDMETNEYVEMKRRQQFLGSPKDITIEWLTSNNAESGVTELMEYSVAGVTYRVDGKKIILDYSEHERRVAENISQLYKKNIQMVPRITYPQGISTPDFKIDGVGWDLKTISTAGKNVFYNAVKKKKQQASCFIFDISNCPLELSDIMVQIKNLFRTTHLIFIDKVGLYKDGKIIAVYERNKK